MIHKQPNSAHCFLCGVDNPIGLKLSFYDDEDDRVIAHFTPGPEHQGYPGVLHGGLTCALLDETIGRTLMKDDIWAMTVSLNVRYRRPIPIGQPLTVVGVMERLRSRTMEGRGEILLEDGTVAATADAKYMRLPEEQVAELKSQVGKWAVMPDEKR